MLPYFAQTYCKETPLLPFCRTNVTKGTSAEHIQTELPSELARSFISTDYRLPRLAQLVTASANT